MCRASSNFITPSSQFWKHGTEEKTKVVKAYKDSMARVPCRYFQKSLQKNKDKPLCPYGKDCFYQHLNLDGTPYIFKDGVDASMRKYRHNFSTRGAGLSFSFGSDDIHFMPFTSLLDSMTIPIPLHLSGARTPARRDRERQVIDNFLRIHPFRAGGTSATQTQTDAQTQTSRRLRDVSRSLDMLHDAIGEDGTSLEHLSDAVEALRAGLGGLEAGARHRGTRRDGVDAGHDRWFETGDDDPAEMTAEEDAARQEDVADQMLASINALRLESRGLDQASDADDGEMPPLERIPNSDSDDSDGEEDLDMPHLESVSNTSDSDLGDDDDDDGVPDLDSDGDSDGDMPWPWQRHLQRLGSNSGNTANSNTNNNIRRRHIQQALYRRGGGVNANRNNARGTRPAATNANSSEDVNEATTPDVGLPTGMVNASIPSINPTPSTSTPLITTTGSDSTPARQGTIPEFIPSGMIQWTSQRTTAEPSTSFSPVSLTPPPTKLEVPVEVEASSSRSSIVVEPPFVTDGRGRVVWTSSSEEVSTSSSASASASSPSPSPSQAAVETQSQNRISGIESTSIESDHDTRGLDLKTASAGLTDEMRSGDNINTRPVVTTTTDTATDEPSANGGGRRSGSGNGGGGNTLFDWFNSLF
ncbi:hypothetical protein M413DRAFT_9184 [Hebeloma cylindrosporum]|uniref:C3H1-type domain-containing protein n=1 Tax=Hebeloma cylindrosporum TaxID=76867 RepID=A0A0C3CMI4_HEBCY|nr:hypothetical protein M413DRAFT_9184 [Hebeloma cylindrosporum h7]